MTSVTGLVEEAVRRTPARHLIDPEQGPQFLCFNLVGLSGAAVNTVTFLAAIQIVHYLAAAAVAFGVAVTWNFVGNYHLTYSRPDGVLHRQYVQFVAVALGGFGFHSGTLVIMIDGLGSPPLLANVVGIGTAAVWNWVGVDEFAFDEDASAGAKAATNVNRLAHLVFRGRVKHRLEGTPVYHALYSAYAMVVGVLTPAVSQVAAGGSEVRISTRTGPEAVSVLHTQRKEQPVLDAFATAVDAEDVVWDVGANLGVFALVGAGQGADVVAVEPHPETASQLQANAASADTPGRVDGRMVALGREAGHSSLVVDRDEVGTQTPRLDDSGRDGVDVMTMTGDELLDGEVPAPDVLKVDVEGAEMDVLVGMSHALESCRLVFVEAHSPGQATAIRRFLEDDGFAVKQVHRYGTERYLQGMRP